jgi:ankyrin repeat protein
MLASTGSATRSFSNLFTYFFDDRSVFVAQEASVREFIRPVQTSLLMALPTEILFHLLQHTNDLISPLLLSTTCTLGKKLYEDVRFYQAHERQAHIFLYNLTIPALHDQFYATLFNKRQGKVTIPAPHSFKWIQLRDHPLSAKGTRKEYDGAFIQKTYITVWDLLLQPTVLKNQSQTLELMGIMLALLPHIHNADRYAQELFEEALPTNLLKKLINIHIDWGLQLICRHFSKEDIHDFAADLAPLLPGVIKAAWPEIHDGQHNSFLHCVLGYFVVFCTHEKLNALLNRLLLCYEADYNVKDKNGNTPLMLACKYKQLALVKLLVQQPYIKLDTTNHQRESALDYAVKYGTVPIVHILLDHKIKIKRYFSAFSHALSLNKIEMINILWQRATLLGSDAFIHQTLLHAITVGETRVVDQLIKDYGANPNTTNKAGLSILRLALQQQDLLLLDTLLQSPHFTIEIAKSKKGKAAVMYASTLRRFPTQWLAQLITRLFAQREDCNTQDRQGNTPLILACMHNQEALVKLLLQQKNIDVSATNQQGLSALDYAVKYSTRRVVQMLLAYGVNLEQHLKAFNHAVKFKQVNMTLALLKKVTGLSVFIAQALAYAITEGEAKVAYILIKDYAAPANTLNHFGASALTLALQKQHTLLLNLLLQFPELELITQPQTQGKTALHYALELRLYPGKQLVELVTRLIIQGADCNAIDEEGNTPLMLACKHPHKALVLLLLRQNPIDMNRRNQAGFSALDYVVKYGSATLLQTLLQYKINDEVSLRAFDHAVYLKKADMIRVLQQYADAKKLPIRKAIY